VPFLRIIRDKRGYETTYLMHWYKDGARQRSRILYVFRTPGGVRVGRSPLEPEILRTIEANYPDISFDWRAVRDNQQVVEPPPELRRPRKRKAADDEAAVPAGDTVKSVTALLGVGQPRPEPAQPSRPSIPSALEGATPDEQIAFLAKWYPLVRDRVPQRTADPARRDALLALAERLNTATWTDADQITAGLQQAGEALERLSRVFARRRRRSRRAKSPDRTGTREASHSEPATPKPHPPAPARSALSDVEGQNGEGGQPSPDIPPPEE
jgi:hypothetical protein